MKRSKTTSPSLGTLELVEDEQGPGYLASQESYGFDEDVLDMDEYEGVIDHDLGDLPVGWAASGAGLDAYHVLGDATLSDYASTMPVSASRTARFNVEWSRSLLRRRRSTCGR